MPFKSQAQRKAMYAAASGNSNVGIPQDAAKSFIAHSQGEDMSGLPQRVGAPAKSKPKKKRRLKAKRKVPGGFPRPTSPGPSDDAFQGY